MAWALGAAFAVAMADVRGGKGVLCTLELVNKPADKHHTDAKKLVFGGIDE